MTVTVLNVLTLLMAIFGDWETFDDYKLNLTECTKMMVDTQTKSKIWIYKDMVVYHQKKGLWYVFYKNTDTD